MGTTTQEVWQLLGKLIEAQKETDRRFQETAPAHKEIDLILEAKETVFEWDTPPTFQSRTWSATSLN